MLIEVRKDAFENIGVVDAQGNAATFILNNATRLVCSKLFTKIIGALHFVQHYSDN